MLQSRLPLIHFSGPARISRSCCTITTTSSQSIKSQSAMATYRFQSSACGRVHRRTFLADVGMGFTGLALGAMLQRDGFASDAASWSPPNGLTHFAPKAKSVIWLFMISGVSHLESFDPKPALNKYAGTSIGDTPFKSVLDKKFLDEKIRTA